MTLTYNPSHSSKPEAEFFWTDGVQRNPLPIDQHLQKICKILDTDREILVAASTGTGKTLRLTQMALQRLKDEPNSKVFVLEPKKVLAIRGAYGVTRELNGLGSTKLAEVGDIVGYKVRGTKDRTSLETKAEFRIKQSFLNEILKTKDKLPEGIIIIDEFHDTSWVNDLLFALISERLPQNPKTSVIYATATPDLEMITSFRPNLQVVNCSARLYPIERRIEPLRNGEHHSEAAIRLAANLLENFSSGALTGLGLHGKISLESGTILVLLPGKFDIQVGISKLSLLAKKLRVTEFVEFVPCHSEVSHAVLTSIEDAPKEGLLRFVLATDTGREGLTISGIKYVIDSGQVKRNVLSQSGAESLEKVVVDNFALEQGIGRLGRTEPGIHILISSEQDNRERKDKPSPEVYVSSISAMVMHLLSQGKDLSTYRLPYALRSDHLQRTIRRLQMIGFLDEEYKLTERGLYGYSRFPFEPEQSASMIKAEELGCLPETIIALLTISKGNLFDISSAHTALQLAPDLLEFIEKEEGGDNRLLSLLGVKSVSELSSFVIDNDNSAHRDARRELYRLSRQYFCDGDTSDFSAIIGAVREYHRIKTINHYNERELDDWCAEHLIHHPKLREVYREAQLMFKQLGMSFNGVGEQYEQDSITEAITAGFPHLLLRNDNHEFISLEKTQIRLAHQSVFSKGNAQFAIASPVSKRNIGNDTVSFVYYADIVAPVSTRMIIENLKNILSRIPQNDYRVTDDSRGVEQNILYRLHQWNVDYRYEDPVPSNQTVTFLRDMLLEGRLDVTPEIDLAMRNNLRIIEAIEKRNIEPTNWTILPLTLAQYLNWLSDRLVNCSNVAQLEPQLLKLPIEKYRILLLEGMIRTGSLGGPAH